MSNLLQQVVQPQGHHTTTYIYGLVDPRNQTIRYIGKSVNPPKRLATHLSKSSLKKHSHKNNWIKILLDLGLKPELEILDQVDYRDDWAEEEIKWIARLKNLAGYPPLTNATDGGEGVEGCVMPEDIRKKISNANRGVPKSAEAHIQFSKGQRNRWNNASKEERKEMLKNLRNPQSAERRKDSSNRARNAPRTPEASSRYRNVVRVTSRGKKSWKAGCIISGKQICIGYFPTEEDAARARDKYVLKHIGENVILNFLRSQYAQNPSDIVIEKARRSHSKILKNNTSGYKGIFKNGKNGWATSITYAGIRYRLGTHRTREDAARRYDLKAIELLGDDAILNFPRSNYQ